MLKAEEPCHVNRRAVLTGVAALGVVSGRTSLAAPAPEAAPSALARATVSADGVMHIPAHDVPMPTSVSPQARQYLQALAGRPVLPGVDERGDTADQVRKRVAAFDRGVGGYRSDHAAASRTRVEQQIMGCVPVYVAVREESTESERSLVNINIHGGAFVYGGGRMVMYDAQLMARARGGTVISVDYRMPPDHPFPAAPDDCLAVYRAALERYGAGKILVSGESSGGNLAAVLMLKARAAGLPAPRALMLNTPATDFSTVGDSRSVNAYVDVVLKAAESDETVHYVKLYANGADPTNPYLSPLRGDLRDFPATYLRTGTRDLLLSDTVRMHAALRKAGVQADLYVGEGMPHGGFPSTAPEVADMEADLGRWLDRQWRT